jgi:transposase
MGIGRPIPPLTLTDHEREVLRRWTRRPTTAQALAQRAHVILECAADETNARVARKLRLTKQTVGKWRSRFLTKRLDGLLDDPRPGAPRTVSDAQVEAVVTLTLESTPRDATHWSTRAVAARCGLSQTTVSRIWRASGLQPHRTDTFKLSPDPLFVEKNRDIVGLYLDPPERALVLCVDEKSQIQALDRTQPLLPMRPGQPERRTHDYVRHGTTSLFAALGVMSGKIIGQCLRRHRAVEFRRFLDTIEAAVPADLDVHLILDSYATHKTPAIRRWLAKRPRYHLHFTPIGRRGSTWWNAGSRCSPRSSSDGACTAARAPRKPRSWNTLPSATPIRTPLCGLRAPTRSSPVSSDFVGESQTHETRTSWPGLREYVVRRAELRAVQHKDLAQEQ